MKFPTYKHETEKIAQGYTLVAGCDEVGIAPLAGPVVAATVILDPDSIGKQRSKNKWWYRVRDSKTTTEKERAELVRFITDHCLDYAVGVVPQEIIDKINIHQAGMQAMKESLGKLKLIPDYLFLDGIHKIKNISTEQQAIIGGDEKVLSIAAASIVAKVSRDKILAEYHDMYPVYGFANHKGYGTKQHKHALLQYGVCDAHRKSFMFVKQCLEKAVPQVLSI